MAATDRIRSNGYVAREPLASKKIMYRTTKLLSAYKDKLSEADKVTKLIVDIFILKKYNKIIITFSLLMF